MDIYVARQPIFDRQLNILGYELLYRNGKGSTQSIDGDQATSEVIINSFLLIGIDELTNGKPAFINFTANLLKQEIPTVFSNQSVVIEILEDIEPDEEIINTCKKLKEQGYQFALDDFVYHQKFDPFIEIADFIKVDFLSSTLEQKKAIVQLAQNKNIKLLAEKVETQEAFNEAVQLGYTYFQGYFFSKPIILSGKDVPRYNMNCIHILEEINKAEPEIHRITGLFESDVSLSYKLIRLINSVGYQITRRITSVKQAIALLGFNEIRKWISLTILQDLGQQKHEVIIRDSMLRAKFGELLANTTSLKNRSSEVFLLGMFSNIDVLMNCTLADALHSLPISDDIKQCLLDHEPSTFRDLYLLITAYETGEWDTYDLQASKLNLDHPGIVTLYLQAVKWVQHVFTTNQGTEMQS